MSKRDEYVAKMKSQLEDMNSQLEDMNSQLDKLAAKSHNAKKEIQAKYKQEMADLRAQSSKASDSLEGVKTAGEEGWDSMVASHRRW